MVILKDIEKLIQNRFLVLDGAMGTQIQDMDIPKEAWGENEGCNELLNDTFSEGILEIHRAYAEAGANIIKTNTFGALPWVLDDYGLGAQTYELAKKGAELVSKACRERDSKDEPRFVAASLGPGTKLPSLGHIGYDEMYEGYKIAAKGLIDGGSDLFLIETAQDPLQIKACIHAITDVQKEKMVKLPIMVSVTIELSGTMLIGTDVHTIATILKSFDILSLGFNCGTGPVQVEKHLKTLSEIWQKPISIHANAGLPQNRGGKTFYPMDPKEFCDIQARFADIDGIALMGGCCGTTPKHIEELAKRLKGKKPLPPKGFQVNSLASLFETKAIKQTPPPFLVGERSNSTGSKAFRELLLKEDYEGTLSVAQQQVRSGAHGIDVSVGFAGRDESKDMKEVVGRYSQKISLPLMVDTTQIDALEAALKLIGGKPIINSVNLEDGMEKFDKVCTLAKRFGCSLVCLTIDETGMAKTIERKVEVATRIYKLAVEKYGFDPSDLVFDLLTFTVGSGDEEYFTAAVDTIEAIKRFHKMYPEVGFVLGVSNISFGLAKHAREYLNSVFLHHCVEAGLSMAIVNVKNIIPMHKISDEQRKVCEDLLFNKRVDGDPLFRFIDYFSDIKEINKEEEDEAFNKLNDEEKLAKLLIDGDKERMMPLLEEVKDKIDPQKIVNEILIDAMKVVGELFGSGQMQLPFVLQSAEVMKAAVDFLKPYLPKIEKESETTLILGTVKGDVHDVGKNLVDIILSNNGFKVINLGIKVDIEDFIRAYKEHKADAIGMSGLLVKSTSVMKENLETLKSKGITVPVLLGGAALTDNFVEDYCRTNYDGAVFYCKDAFEGIEAMSRIEKGDLNTDLGGKKKEQKLKKTKKEYAPVPSFEDIKMPSKVIVPTPPFWGRRVLKTDVKEIAFEWINHKMLFSRAWGYSGKGMSKEEKQKQRDEVLWPLYERVKRDILRLGLFEPTVIYGYYPSRGYKDDIFIFDESEGFFSDKEANRESLESIKQRAIKKLSLPRQKRKPYRCLSDYLRDDRHDVLAVSCVSAGDKFSLYEKELFEKGEFKEYHLVHGISIELTEALAEVAHKQIRLDLNIAKNEGHSLRDVKMRAYQGCRYSFGYASCPNLADNQLIFDLLKPEEFGVTISETYQMHPEQTTTAIVFHHKEAIYFNVE